MTSRVRIAKHFAHSISGAHKRTIFFVFERGGYDSRCHTPSFILLACIDYYLKKRKRADLQNKILPPALPRPVPQCWMLKNPEFIFRFTSFHSVRAAFAWFQLVSAYFNWFQIISGNFTPL